MTIAVESQFKQLRSSPEKSFSGLQRDSNPWPLRSRCSALPAELHFIEKIPIGNLQLTNCYSSRLLRSPRLLVHLAPSIFSFLSFLPSSALSAHPAQLSCLFSRKKKKNIRPCLPVVVYIMFWSLLRGHKCLIICKALRKQTILDKGFWHVAQVAILCGKKNIT